MFKSLMITTALLSSLSVFAADMQLDLANSKLTYTGRKVVSSHTGEVSLKSGMLKFDKKNNLTGGEFIIDMESINNKDIENPEYNKKLVDHLKSDDFFNVDKFKTSKLVIKDVKKMKGNNYKITGDLTIRDTTAPVTFDAAVSHATSTATAKIVFDRTKYGVKFSSGKFIQNLGDKLILDDIELDINLKLIN